MQYALNLKFKSQKSKHKITKKLFILLTTYNLFTYSLIHLQFINLLL